MAKRVLIGGGSGLIGQHLTQLLTEKGYEVAWLSHSGSKGPVEVFRWNPMEGKIPSEAILGSDYFINLAGAGIADKRWTDKRKELIIQSRTKPNVLLADLLSKDKGNLKAYISASAMGIYGDSGDEWCAEEDVRERDGFLYKSVSQWESSIHEVASTGLRTAYLRTGMVLSTQGGALAKMLPTMKLGVAAYFGSGKQFISWIHIDDIAQMYIHAMEQNWEGPYNAAASTPHRMKQFTNKLIDAHSGYQVAVPAPAIGLRLVFGEMADALLSSNRLRNDKAKQGGYNFQHDQLKEAFEDLIERQV